MANVQGKKVKDPKVIKQKEVLPTYEELQEQNRQMQKTLSYYVDMEIAFSECKKRHEECEAKLHNLTNVVIMLGGVNPILSK